MQRNVNVSRTVARHLLAPGLDRLRGTHTMRCLKQLEQSQWWPTDRIETLQSERLRRLIRHAYERVPYYRHLMDHQGVGPDSVRSAADLASLPVLTKTAVREHMSELLAEGFPVRELLHGRTSGSTGTPLAFYSSRESRWSHGLARSLRALEYAGVYPGDPILHIDVQGVQGFTREAPFKRLARLVSREVSANCVDFSDASLPYVVEGIARMRPRALRGYASALCIIAGFIQDSCLPAPPVGAVVTGGEQLFEEQRTLLRDVFEHEPFSKYSSFENYDIAMECEAHAGLHVAAEDLIVEVVDDEGRTLKPGDFGRVLVTSLHEYGMPLIRYDTEDESRLVAGICACGRSLPRLSAVTGRACGTIYTPSGRRLSSNSLDSSGLVPLGVRQFQLVQDEIDHAMVRIVLNAGGPSDDAETIKASVKAHFAGWLKDDIRVDVDIVDRIEPTPAGKHLYLISHVKPPCDRR